MTVEVRSSYATVNEAFRYERNDLFRFIRNLGVIFRRSVRFTVFLIG